mgnify:CR=1 FL=1
MSKSTKTIIHWVIVLTFIFGFGFLPPICDGITPFGMQALGIFLGLIYGWCFLDFLCVSFISVLAIGLTDYTTVLGAFGKGFSDQLFLMVLLLLMIVGYLEESGLPTLITQWFMTRKILQGHPYLLFASIFICSGLLLAMGLSLGGILLVWVILYDVFNTLGYKKGDMVVTYVLFGVVVLGVIGNNIPHFQMFSVTIISLLEQTLGVSISIGKWWIFNTIYFIVYLLAYLALGKFILKLDISKFLDCDNIFNSLTSSQVTSKQKIAGYMMIIFIAILMLPIILPSNWPITIFLGKFGLVGGAVILMTITSILRINGNPVTNWNDNARRGINWGLLSMFFALAPVSAALESEEAGVMSTVTSALTPMLDGLPVALFYFITFLVFFILTQFAHNLLLMMILTPTLLKLCVVVGANPFVLIIGICAVAQMAYMTPGASSPGAMFYGNSDWITTKQTYFMAAIGSLLGFLIIILLIPLASMLF